MSLTFLGTGTSAGVPMIACDCAVCRSEDPRDRRMRSSALLRVDGRQLLIDATPELRLQSLRQGLRRVDACLVTHTHADHIFGLDDLRRFNQVQGEAIEIFAAGRHLATLEKIFGYGRCERSNGNVDLPQFVFREFAPDGEVFEAAGVGVRAFALPHGRFTVSGFRVGGLAYCTDVSEVPPEIYENLAGLEVLVLGALRAREHPAHLNFAQAVEAARRIGARRTFFTHMSHQVSHERMEKELPEGITLAYDGLTVSC